MGISDWISDASRDVRFAIRSLARERGFTAFVVITLALGIGANAAMFGIVDRLLLRGPLHVRDAGQMRRVISTTQPPGRGPQRTGYLGYVQYETFRADTQTFAGVAAYNFLSGGAVLGQGASARPINSGTATASFFPLVGVTPALGRFFDEREDDPYDPQPVVVLGYALWQSEFGGRRGIIGNTVHLNHRPHVVIGVVPKGFTGVDLAKVDVWRPESGAAHSTNWRTLWGAPWLHIVVRLRPGVSPEHAGASLTLLHRGAYPGRDSVLANASISVEPLHYTYAGTEATETRVSRWLLAVAGIVLLITCANVVNLLLARIIKRRRELAVRLALGAGRMRVLRLLVMETLLLTSVGGAAAIGVAYALGASARSLIAEVDWVSDSVDPRILWAIGGFSLLTCLLVGIVPAVQGTKAQLSEALKAGVRDGGGRQSWFRTALTISQAAFSVVLLVGAGLFVQSLRHARTADLGIDTDRIVIFEPERMGASYYYKDSVSLRRELDRRHAFLPMVVERLRSRLDVERVAIAGGVPFNRPYRHPIRVPGRDSIPHLPGGGPFVTAVSDDYFATVGTRILRGRPFTAEDRAGSAPVAVINETAARTLWPGESPLAKCVVVADATACAEVVGVASNTKRSSLRDEEAMQIYVPLDQREFGARERLVVRPRPDTPAADIIAEVRRELVRLDPLIWYVDVDVLQERVETESRPWRLGATVFTLFGLLALLVASVGLYSVMSYFVSQRTREIGVRMALGARPSDISRLVLSNGLTLVGTGVAIGLVLAFLGARALAPLLFDTSPNDPIVFTVVALTMVAVAIPAAWLPTLRARRIDPIESIRVE